VAPSRAAEAAAAIASVTGGPQRTSRGASESSSSSPSTPTRLPRVPGLYCLVHAPQGGAPLTRSRPLSWGAWPAAAPVPRGRAGGGGGAAGRRSAASSHPSMRCRGPPGSTRPLLRWRGRSCLGWPTQRRRCSSSSRPRPRRTPTPCARPSLAGRRGAPARGPSWAPESRLRTPRAPLRVARLGRARCCGRGRRADAAAGRGGRRRGGRRRRTSCQRAAWGEGSRFPSPSRAASSRCSCCRTRSGGAPPGAGSDAGCRRLDLAGASAPPSPGPGRPLILAPAPPEALAGATDAEAARAGDWLVPLQPAGAAAAGGSGCVATMHGPAPPLAGRRWAAPPCSRCAGPTLALVNGTVYPPPPPPPSEAPPAPAASGGLLSLFDGAPAPAPPPAPEPPKLRLIVRAGGVRCSLRGGVEPHTHTPPPLTHALPLCPPPPPAGALPDVLRARRGGGGGSGGTPAAPTDFLMIALERGTWRGPSEPGGSRRRCGAPPLTAHPALARGRQGHQQRRRRRRGARGRGADLRRGQAPACARPLPGHLREAPAAADGLAVGLGGPARGRRCHPGSRAGSGGRLRERPPPHRRSG